MFCKWLWPYCHICRVRSTLSGWIRICNTVQRFASARSLSMHIRKFRGLRFIFNTKRKPRAVAFLEISVGGCSGRATALKILGPAHAPEATPTFYCTWQRTHPNYKEQSEKISTLPLPNWLIYIAISISTIQICHSVWCIYIEEIVQLVNHSVWS